MKQFDRFYRNLAVFWITVAAVAIFYASRSLLSPVVTALVVAYVLYPLVDRISRIGFPQGILIFLIFLGFLAAFTYSAYSLVPQIQREYRALSPEREQEKDSRLVGICMRVASQLDDYGILRKSLDPRKVASEIRSFLESQRRIVLNSVGDMVRGTFQFMLIFFFVLIFSLKEGDRLNKAIIQVIPNSLFEPGLFMLQKTTELLGHYLRGLVIENLILGVVAFVLLYAVSCLTPLSVTLSILIAAIIALTNAIRIIGPMMGGAFGVLVVLTTSADFHALLGVLIVTVLVQLIDNALALPLVMRKQMDIHPVVCLLGVLAGGIVAGVLGMMLAIPVVGGIKVLHRISTVEMKKFNMDPETVA